ncbi:unnamed protein product [Ectocarpus sp. 6 AP-2014]
MAGYGGADLLLSTEWGRGMEVDLPERCFQELSAAGVAPAAVGSEAVAKLAVAVKPRYHFAASEGAFFQRPPYRNYGSSGCMHTTRFISLGELAAGSAAPKDKTKKWVHALNLEPIAFMKKDELSKRSADTTDCPYPVDPNNRTVFVGNLRSGDVSAEQLEALFRAAGPLSGLPGAGKSGFGGGPHKADGRLECWFCLASPQLEDHLVCSVADEIYLAQPKGGLVPGHVLIVPVSHQQRYSELSAEGAKEAEQYKESFKRYCLSCGCEPFFFERCVPTKGAHHLHIQAVPIPAGEGSRGARILMRSEGTRHGMTFQEVPDDADLRATLKDGSYFYAELPGDVVGSRVRLIHRVAEGGNIDARGNRRHVPLQFGRDVAAKLLSMPERAHWRDCSLPKAKEILQADIFKEAFKAFDFTQEEGDEEPEEDAAAAADGMEVDEPVSGQKRPAGEEGGNGGDEPEKRARGPA